VVTTRELARGWWQEMRTVAVAAPEAVNGDEAETQADMPATSSPTMPPVPAPAELMLDGVVYTTVVDPTDGAENWSDLIAAFCWAFKRERDATLIVNMCIDDIEYYRVALMTQLSRLAPFECRVIILHGLTGESEYRALVEASTYYVAALSNAGCSIPLLEFLSCGKPAVAPDHTGFADYIAPDLAFVTRYARAPSPWPHDPAGMLETFGHRLNAESLIDAFCDSHRVARAAPETYAAMAQAAVARMQQISALHAATAALETVFRALAPPAPMQPLARREPDTGLGLAEGGGRG
jgi:glycosyltransferase involved in cell wall biosynthesis